MKKYVFLFLFQFVLISVFPQSNLTENLIAGYPFNSNADDETGNGHDGSIFGPTITTDRFGQNDAAYDFDGTDDYIEVPDHPDLVFGDSAFSLVTWIFPEAWTGNTGLNCIISKANSDEGAWLFRVVKSAETGNIAKLNFEGGLPNLRFFANSEITLNEWHMVSITRSGNNFTFYLDGVADGSFTYSKTFISTFPIRVSGQGDKTDERFNGKIDDIFIYGKELDAQEITDLYNITQNACLHEPWFDYGGQIYPTVQIGYQCWMAEDLNHGTMIPGGASMSNNGVVEKYCYNNDPYNCDTLGGTFYQWNEAMNYISGESGQGICPDGWHLPSDAEWCFMEQNIDTTIDCPASGYHGTDIGFKLKVGGSSGFEAILGGDRWNNTSFMMQGLSTHYWTTTWGGGNMVAVYGYYHDHDDAKQVYDTWNAGHSIRCLINNEPPYTPENPIPETGSSGIANDTLLAWSCSDPTNQPLYYSLYLGIDPDPSFYIGNIAD
ncbi:MAG: hypothetical protein K8R53_06405, partial [Bacteroidales bacterium]|nr:hypothetical protein [Bacteroidales bacterium]